jgi:hypothetical protein
MALVGRGEACWPPHAQFPPNSTPTEVWTALLDRLIYQPALDLLERSLAIVGASDLSLEDVMKELLTLLNK